MWTWYDPALGRFTQPDSLVPQPDSPLGGLICVHANNLIKYNDPTGHLYCDGRFASNCDPYSNSIEGTSKRLRIRITGNWTTKDRVSMLHGFEKAIESLFDAATEFKKFREVAGSMKIELLTSEGWCVRSRSGFICGRAALNKMNDRLAVHEFSHVFDNRTGNQG
jgi:hypothetical protein